MAIKKKYIEFKAYKIYANGKKKEITIKLPLKNKNQRGKVNGI